MVQLALFLGKVAFIVVLYAFLFYVVRLMSRDLRMWTQLHLETSTGVGLQSLMQSGEGEEVSGASQSSWTLVVERAPRRPKGERIYLSSGESLLVGRAPDCDLELADTFVSAHHARFTVTPEGLVVRDLNSTNGTYVNGEPVDDVLLLRPGDRVAIGDSVLVVAKG